MRIWWNLQDIQATKTQAAPAQTFQTRVPLPVFPLEPDAPPGRVVFFRKLLELAEEIKDMFDIRGVRCDEDELNKELMVTIMQCMEKQKGHRDWWFKIVYNSLRNPPKDSPHLTEAHHLMLCSTRREALRLWSAEFESYDRLLAMSRFAQEGFPPICNPPAAAPSSSAAAAPSSDTCSEPSPTPASPPNMSGTQPSDSAAVSAEAAGQATSSSAHSSLSSVLAALEINAAGPSSSTQMQPVIVPQIPNQTFPQQQPLGRLTGTAEPVRSADGSLHASSFDSQPVPPMAAEAGAPPQLLVSSASSQAQSATPASAASPASLYNSPRVTVQQSGPSLGPQDAPASPAPPQSFETMQMFPDPGPLVQHRELPSGSGNFVPPAIASKPGTAPLSAGHTAGGMDAPSDAFAAPAEPGAADAAARAGDDACQPASGIGKVTDAAQAQAAMDALSAAQSHEPFPGNDHITPAPATPAGVTDNDTAPADAGHPAGHAAGGPQEPTTEAQAAIGPVDQAQSAMDAALASQSLRLPPPGGRITTEQLRALGRRLQQQQQPQPPGTNPATVRTLGAAAVGHQAGPPAERIEVGTALVRAGCPAFMPFCMHALLQ